jgi:predicted dehydrogenase/threonine dehydrogenase-like Zn-dependent dehydrogenase
MKQLLQNVRNGQLCLAEVPVPQVEGNRLLVRTEASLISAGTERMVAQLARKGLLGKAKARPDLVKKVLAKLRRDGFWATLHSVQQQLDRWMPLGYSATGEVLAVGSDVTHFKPGQRVACAGAGIANHAEYNVVPELLAAGVPSGVTPEEAAYATVGAIALHGVRNADVRVGEYVVVIGLGLLGQLAVQILRAAGCHVAGLDPVPSRCELAEQGGAELTLTPDHAAIAAVKSWSYGLGADAVIITAATASNIPVELAAELARDRARVVMVGVTGMNIPRKPYYEKELTFIVSRSYGPGRYDRNYEDHGHDYPPGYVRWTEQRNLQAFLELVATGSVKPCLLTTHRLPIDQAAEAFELMLHGKEPYLGIVLTYPTRAEDRPGTRVELPTVIKPIDKATLGVSFVGAGNFAQAVLLPILRKHPRVRFRGIVTASGVTARMVGDKYNFAWCATDFEEIVSDPETDVVFIVTRHSQHAPMVCRALEAGKVVFCEKPLAITPEQLEQVRQMLEKTSRPLMVGFNRRFAPLAQELKRFVQGRGPLSVTYRVNAGSIPPDHWLADPAEGGRIIGEACHFFDFFAYLTDSHPVECERLSPDGVSPRDDGQFLVRYGDGSICHLVYTTTGSPGFSKERVEVHAGGATAVLEDFRTLVLDDGRHRRRKRLWQADKGHGAAVSSFLTSILEGKPMPIAPGELFETMNVTLAAAQAGGWQQQPANNGHKKCSV